MRLLRDVYNDDVEKFVVSDKDLFNELLKYAKKLDSGLKKVLKYYDKKTDMFEY